MSKYSYSQLVALQNAIRDIREFINEYEMGKKGA